VGRFGPYVKWGEDFISLPKGTDLSQVDLKAAIKVIQEKQVADAPVGQFQNKPITKGTGRFGPYLKWDGLFINVSKKYNFQKLSDAEMKELIEAKIKKEENRYIQRWPEEKINLENGRWGPLIKYGKKVISVPKKADNTRYTPEEAAAFTLEEVKSFIQAAIPDAFKSKKQTKAPARKPAAKKTAPAKAATQSSTKKPAAKATSKKKKK
jgi:DNA topoisomerase-1